MLTVGTNTFVTMAEADSYLGDKFGIGVTWSGLTNAEKEQALITAYRWLMGLVEYSLTSSTAVKNAQIELALYIVEAYNEHKKRANLYTQGVRNFSISKWKETLVRGGLPFEVENLLSDYYTAVGTPTFTRD